MPRSLISHPRYFQPITKHKAAQRFCHKCGAEIPSGSAYCQMCGPETAKPKK
ncbi:MAG: zinc-ribbon domain-containing protein [Candidatus Verstraetearchaeota archaeon]|nr:zinc-ribbon domain-containing protein [Candidatus Verstraetearchaeota archaeon]